MLIYYHFSSCSLQDVYLPDPSPAPPPAPHPPSLPHPLPLLPDLPLPVPLPASPVSRCPLQFLSRHSLLPPVLQRRGRWRAGPLAVRAGPGGKVPSLRGDGLHGGLRGHPRADTEQCREVFRDATTEG